MIKFKAIKRNNEFDLYVYEGFFNGYKLLWSLSKIESCVSQIELIKINPGSFNIKLDPFYKYNLIVV